MEFKEEKTSWWITALYVVTIVVILGFSLYVAFKMPCRDMWWMANREIPGRCVSTVINK